MKLTTTSACIAVFISTVVVCYFSQNVAGEEVSPGPLTEPAPVPNEKDLIPTPKPEPPDAGAGLERDTDDPQGIVHTRELLKNMRPGPGVQWRSSMPVPLDESKPDLRRKRRAGEGSREAADTADGERGTLDQIKGKQKEESQTGSENELILGNAKANVPQELMEGKRKSSQAVHESDQEKTKVSLPKVGAGKSQRESEDERIMSKEKLVDAIVRMPVPEQKLRGARKSQSKSDNEVVLFEGELGNGERNSSLSAYNVIKTKKRNSSRQTGRSWYISSNGADKVDTDSHEMTIDEKVGEDNQVVITGNVGTRTLEQERESRKTETVNEQPKTPGVSSTSSDAEYLDVRNDEHGLIREKRRDRRRRRKHKLGGPWQKRDVSALSYRKPHPVGDGGDDKDGKTSVSDAVMYLRNETGNVEERTTEAKSNNERGDNIITENMEERKTEANSDERSDDHNAPLAGSSPDGHAPVREKRRFRGRYRGRGRGRRRYYYRPHRRRGRRETRHGGAGSSNGHPLGVNIERKHRAEQIQQPGQRSLLVDKGMKTEGGVEQGQHYGIAGPSRVKRRGRKRYRYRNRNRGRRRNRRRRVYWRRRGKRDVGASNGANPNHPVKEKDRDNEGKMTKEQQLPTGIKHKVVQKKFRGGYRHRGRGGRRRHHGRRHRGKRNVQKGDDKSGNHSEKDRSNLLEKEILESSKYPRTGSVDETQSVETSLKQKSNRQKVDLHRRKRKAGIEPKMSAGLGGDVQIGDLTKRDDLNNLKAAKQFGILYRPAREAEDNIGMPGAGLIQDSFDEEEVSNDNNGGGDDDGEEDEEKDGVVEDEADDDDGDDGGGDDNDDDNEKDNEDDEDDEEEERKELDIIAATENVGLRKMEARLGRVNKLPAPLPRSAPEEQEVLAAQKLKILNEQLEKSPGKTHETVASKVKVAAKSSAGEHDLGIAVAREKENEWYKKQSALIAQEKAALLRKSAELRKQLEGKDDGSTPSDDAGDDIDDDDDDDDDVVDDDDIDDEEEEDDDDDDDEEEEETDDDDDEDDDDGEDYEEDDEYGDFDTDEDEEDDNDEEEEEDEDAEKDLSDSISRVEVKVDDVRSLIKSNMGKGRPPSVPYTDGKGHRHPAGHSRHARAAGLNTQAETRHSDMFAGAAAFEKPVRRRLDSKVQEHVGSVDHLEQGGRLPTPAKQYGDEKDELGRNMTARIRNSDRAKRYVNDRERKTQPRGIRKREITIRENIQFSEKDKKNEQDESAKNASQQTNVHGIIHEGVYNLIGEKDVRDLDSENENLVGRNIHKESLSVNSRQESRNKSPDSNAPQNRHFLRFSSRAAETPTPTVASSKSKTDPPAIKVITNRTHQVITTYKTSNVSDVKNVYHDISPNEISDAFTVTPTHQAESPYKISNEAKLDKEQVGGSGYGFGDHLQGSLSESANPESAVQRDRLPKRTRWGGLQQHRINSLVNAMTTDTIRRLKRILGELKTIGNDVGKSGDRLGRPSHGMNWLKMSRMLPALNVKDSGRRFRKWMAKLQKLKDGFPYAGRPFNKKNMRKLLKRVRSQLSAPLLHLAILKDPRFVPTKLAGPSTGLNSHEVEMSEARFNPHKMERSQRDRLGSDAIAALENQHSDSSQSIVSTIRPLDDSTLESLNKLTKGIARLRKKIGPSEGENGLNHDIHKGSGHSNKGETYKEFRQLKAFAGILKKARSLLQSLDTGAGVRSPLLLKDLFPSRAPTNADGDGVTLNTVQHHPLVLRTNHSLRAQWTMLLRKLIRALCRLSRRGLRRARRESKWGEWLEEKGGGESKGGGSDEMEPATDAERGMERQFHDLLARFPESQAEFSLNSALRREDAKMAVKSDVMKAVVAQADDKSDETPFVDTSAAVELLQHGARRRRRRREARGSKVRLAHPSRTGPQFRQLARLDNRTHKHSAHASPGKQGKGGRHGYDTRAAQTLIENIRKKLREKKELDSLFVPDPTALPPSPTVVSMTSASGKKAALKRKKISPPKKPAKTTTKDTNSYDWNYDDVNADYDVAYDYNEVGKDLYNIDNELGLGDDLQQPQEKNKKGFKVNGKHAHKTRRGKTGSSSHGRGRGRGRDKRDAGTSVERYDDMELDDSIVNDDEEDYEDEDDYVQDDVQPDNGDDDDDEGDEENDEDGSKRADFGEREGIQVEDNGKKTEPVTEFAYVAEAADTRQEPVQIVSWGEWSACAVTCGLGHRFRVSTCGPDGEPCRRRQASEEAEVCSVKRQC